MKRLIAVLLLAAALGGPAPAQPQAKEAVQQAGIVPLETFAEFPAIQGPKISPGAR